MANVPQKPAAPKATSYAMTKRLQQAHVREFSLVEGFKKGYRAREDITTLPPGVLVTGSQNVLTNTFQRVGIRNGYTLDGQRDTTPTASAVPILSAFDWKRHTGNTVHVRAGFNTTGINGKMQFRYVASAGDYYNGTTFTANQVYWIDLITGVNSTLFRFGDYWDNTQLLSELLMVNGSSQIWEWSGGITTLASSSNAAGVVSTFNQPGEVLTINAAPTAAGGGYSAFETLNATTGGGNAILTISAVGGGGAVTGFILSSGGGGYAVGVGQATSPVGGGTGAGATVEVTSVAGAPGSGYAVNDVLTAVTTGTGATFKVLAVTSTGGVAQIQLLTPGTGYSAGVEATTTGGAGINCTIKITAVVTGYIRKTGTTSWAEEGFYNIPGNRAVTINGNSYIYSGGETTLYLVGISADPTGEPAQSVIWQTPMVTYNYNIAGLPPTFSNDLISVLKNQVYIGDNDNRSVYVSKLNNYKNYTFSTPRKVGEGAILTLDGSPTALVTQQEAMWIGAGKDYWFFTQFQLSADNQSESLTIEPVKTTGLQAPQSQEMTTKIKNNIAYVSFESMINSLGTAQNYLNDPQTTDLSYSIINDMKLYDFTAGAITYFANQGKYIYVAIPRQSLVLVYNMTDANDVYWEAPQIMPISCFSIIDGELYGHSSQASNSFKLFTGHTDDTHPINAIAKFSFWNQGTRPAYKSSNSFYVEGYIATNTTLTMSLQREVNGSVASWNIVGTDSAIVFSQPDDASLGKVSLGKNSLGGSSTPISEANQLPKFRVEQTFNRVDYFEEQPSFSSYGPNQQWEIIAFGTNASPSSNEPTSIRK